MTRWISTCVVALLLAAMPYAQQPAADVILTNGKIITVDDPKAYTRPWTAATIRQRLLPDDELIEFVCAENEKSTQRFQK